MSVDGEIQADIDGLRARLAELEARLRRTYRAGRPPGAQLEVILVDVGPLRAAFELDAVEEVVPAAALAPLPEAPAWILGTLNLRGRTVPVVHIGARLRGETAALRVEDLIVVAATASGTAGFVVTAVGAITRVALDADPSLTETPHAAYVVGSFTHGDQAWLLLGIQELLRHSDVAAALASGRRSP